MQTPLLHGTSPRSQCPGLGGVIVGPSNIHGHSTPVFFSLFSEAEPFAAVLIAHGTHVFWGTPEARRTEIGGRGRQRGNGSWEGAWGLGSTASSPRRVRGGSLTTNTFRTYYIRA